MTSPAPPPPHRSARKSLLGAAAVHSTRKAAASAASAVVGAVGWPVILAIAAVAVLLVLVLLVIAIVALSRMSDQRENLNYQCESRLGHSVGNTATLAVIPRLATSVTLDQPPATTWETTALQSVTTTPPTTRLATTSTQATTPATSANSTSPTNPYATLTAPPTADAKTAACATALRTGDVVGPPLTTPGNDTGRRAAALANDQVGLLATDTDGSTAGPTNNAFSAANLVRYAYYQASGGEVTLSKDVADQIDTGDRVDPHAISPGDLVFFDFTPTHGPTAVMIAITPTLGIDATTLNQPIAVGVLPTGNVIVKRPRTHAHQEVPTP
jgi:cell wall-associated NlpC family hydrolase